jgi:multidrug efflux pump subunit AcrB
MQSYGVGVDQVIAAIQAENQDLPTGSITRGASEQLVRVEGKIKTPAAFGRIIVADSRGGPVYLQQVADLIDGEAEDTSISRVDGNPGVMLFIFKVQRANAVEVGHNIDRAIKELQGRLPSDVVISTVYANSQFIEGSLKRVKQTIVEGALLTIFIVFLFLHSWRSTVITGLTLPISVVSTFTALHLFGFTLNFITLMALSLCIGLLIDDAIVVRENIVRHRNMGKSDHEAARHGTEEIALAVMATTFSILAVFVPIAFMRGIIGRYFYQFGVTVAVAVLVSLFVSFTLDPMLSSVWRDPIENRFARAPWLGRVMDKIEHGMDRVHDVYGRLLAWALSGRRYRLFVPRFNLVQAIRTRDLNAMHLRTATISSRGIVLLVAAGSFVVGLLLLPLVGTEFIPQADEGTVSLRLNTPLGSSIEYTDAKIKEVEQVLREMPEIETIATTVATDDGKNYAQIILKLIDAQKTHRRSQKKIEESIRARLMRMAGLELTVGWDKAVFISILGPDASELTRLSQELMHKIAKVPGIVDLESSEKGAQPTVAVRISNELASDLGITTARIGNALRPLIAGDEISRWLAPDGQEYDVIVRLPKEQRRIVSDLGDLYVTSSRVDRNGNAKLVPIREVAQFVPTTSAQQLKRLDLQRRVSIYANAQGRPAGDVGSDVEKITKSFKLPPGYRYNVGGSQEDMNDSFAAAIAALAMGIIFIYLILASQFASFVQPIAIMASLPLSLVGVLLALLVTRTTLNMFSMIGFIMLMGLVTKNAILLVDFTNHAVRAGKSVHEAILEAGQVRLRPILMTTLAMIFGMLPMAIGAGLDGELLAPMGRAVIGGVATSTLLTLVVVPVLYKYVYAFGMRFKRSDSSASAPLSEDPTPLSDRPST